MLSYEGDDDQEASANLQSEARLEEELKRQLDAPLPPWLAPVVPEARPQPTVETDPAIPWRSATVAALAQVPATLEALYLDVPFGMLAIQVAIVAMMGLALVLAEWMSINRVGLPVEEPQPNLERR